jgi:hypothetical protein
MTFAQNMAQNSDIRSRLGKRTRDELDKNLMDYTKRPYTPMINSNQAAVPMNCNPAAAAVPVPGPSTSASSQGKAYRIFHRGPVNYTMKTDLAVSGKIFNI